MYDRDVVELALYALSEGYSPKEAAEICGASRRAVAAWGAGNVPHERKKPLAGCGRGVRHSEATKARAIALVRAGATVTEAARELGIAHAGTITGWMRKAEGRRRMEREPDPVLPEVVGDEEPWEGFEGTPEEQIEQLKLENDILRGMVEVLKGASLDQTSNREKSLLIDWLRRETGRPLRELTASLRISKSSYEYWHRKFENPEPTLREEIADDVERIFREDGDSARGYRFVHAKLEEQRGPTTEKAVRDVMRERGLRPVYLRKPKKYSSYAGELDEAPANIPLDEATGRHDFHADAPNEKWVTDITEFKLPDDPRKVYLSPIVDLFDTKPVAWSIGLRPDAELANSSLIGAIATLREGERPFCHTDRGCHYRWPGWKRICEDNGITRSMSRKGRSPDNAAGEGFFGRLKNEFFYGRDWRGMSAEEFIGRLDAWMKFYSEGRLKLFAEADGRRVYDTIDNRRRRLGLAA